MRIKNLRQNAVIVVQTPSQEVNWEHLLTRIPHGIVFIEYSANHKIFSQGDPADSLFFVGKGTVKLAVTSHHGKKAIVAVLGVHEFFGEACLAGQSLRATSATAITDCSLTRIARPAMALLLREHQEISELFATYLLARNIRIEEDLIDQHFNTSVKRLARTLLLLAHFRKETRSEILHPRVTQDDLAQMVGTTRSRISHLMNEFRKHGYVEYAACGGLKVNKELLAVVQHD